MTDARLPPADGDDLRSLEARVRALENAQRAKATSIRGGALVVLDDDGVIVARLGRMPWGADGLAIDDPVGGGSMVQCDNLSGWAAPYIGSSWSKIADAEAVTSGSFVDAWRSRVEQNLSIHARFTCYLATDAGTSAELRVVWSGVPIGNVLSVGGGHGAYHEFSAPTGGQLYAGPYIAALQARRTAGAGNVWVYHPTDVFQGHFSDVIPVTGWIS